MNIEQKIIDFWDKQPCNIKHSQSKIGSKEFFDEQAKKRYLAEPHLKTFAQFHSYQGKRVLEIGCGIGADAIEFVKNGAEYVGIDLSKESIKLCKQRFELENLQGQFYVHNAIDDLSKFGKFDLVYAYGVIHHYPNAKTVIENIANVCNTDSEFKMLVYAKNSWKYAMIRKGLDQYEAQAACPYAKCYTVEDVYELLEKHFKIVRIRQDHCFMYNVDKYKQGIYELEPWFEAMPETMREAVREYLGWHLLVKSVKK